MFGIFTNQINIVKRNGTEYRFFLEKRNKVVEFYRRGDKESTLFIKCIMFSVWMWFIVGFQKNRQAEENLDR